MLEYFTYKKYKKNKAEKAKEEAKAGNSDSAKQSEDAKTEPEPTQSPAPVTPAAVSDSPGGAHEAAPVLDDEDESFLESILSRDGEHAPPLPPRVKTPELSWDSDSSRMSGESSRGKAAGKEKDKSKVRDKGKGKAKETFNRLSLIFKKDAKKADHLAVPTSSESEEDKERRDISRVLDDLNLSAQNNKAFSLSAESNELVRKFTVVLKDLVNGVPTAYDDLVGLLEDRDGVLSKQWESLPSSMKKLVTTLPNKLSAGLAPELLAAAAESQGMKASELGEGKSAAMKFLKPTSLHQLVTKPGAVVGMLRAIVNALKLRWPAFMSVNVIWSVALFLLLFVLWYCHKRGREVRLEREKSDMDGRARVEELDDDPQLPPPAGTPLITETLSDQPAKTELPPPPVGAHAGKSEPRK